MARIELAGLALPGIVSSLAVKGAVGFSLDPRGLDYAATAPLTLKARETWRETPIELSLDGLKGLNLEKFSLASRAVANAVGPSVVRIFRITLAGWKRYKNHPDARIRRRYAWESRELGTTMSAAVGAAERYFRKNPAIHAKLAAFLSDLHREFGLKSRLASLFGGWYVLRKIRAEEKRLAEGWTYEPPTFYERNFNPATPAGKSTCEATLCHCVSAGTSPLSADSEDSETTVEQEQLAVIG